ncbi:MAG: HAD-IA family hydrolase [Candidatus Micrarchaeota archaeon]|nr:HAD-IA family hydrolase [Candidatus Micrarchaeota archaeon]
MNKITDIIFDWGGVLALADNALAASVLSKKYGFNKEKLQKAIGKAEDKHSETTTNYHGFFKEVQQQFQIPTKEITAALNAAHATNMLKVAKKLKKKYGVHILSNQMHFRTRFIRAHNDLSFFDAVVFSSEVGMMKPQKRIYRYMLRKIKCRPQQCLFIDNNKANVEAAKKLGINVILFKSEVQFKSELKRFGVDVN